MNMMKKIEKTKEKYGVRERAHRRGNAVRNEMMLAAFFHDPAGVMHGNGDQQAGDQTNEYLFHQGNKARKQDGINYVRGDLGDAGSGESQTQKQTTDG